MRVLVVDDTQYMRQEVIDSLPFSGITPSAIVEAADGREALEIVARSEAFDLVLTDRCMPRVDGMELIEKLRLSGHAMPIVMITTDGSLATREAALEAGANGFLTKPATPERLTPVLLACL